jgi:hypothetical protein
MVLRHRRSILAQLLFSTITCVLVAAVSVSEIPEHLTLTDDTSNDYTLQSPTPLKIIRALSSVKQVARLFVTTVPVLPSWQLPSTIPEGAGLQVRSLLILYSVLRT